MKYEPRQKKISIHYLYCHLKSYQQNMSIGKKKKKNLFITDTNLKRCQQNMRLDIKN